MIHSNLTLTITVDIDDVIDLRTGRVVDSPIRSDKPDLLYLVTSVEATGANAVEWSSNGEDFYELEGFSGVIRLQPSDVLGIRFIKVTGAADTADVTITQL